LARSPAVAARPPPSAARRAACWSGATCPRPGRRSRSSPRSSPGRSARRAEGSRRSTRATG
jgi:hypothetical protein